MKLLFDQNLSDKLMVRLSDIFPGSSHVKIHYLSKEDDLVIWRFALKNDFTIVTQDSDFYDLALLHGTPPKIVWIRSGNSATNHIEEIIRSNTMAILHLKSDNKICLELF
jgi:predicted nuclease of predicted toxin-antitoxin system